MVLLTNAYISGWFLVKLFCPIYPYEQRTDLDSDIWIGDFNYLSGQ